MDQDLANHILTTVRNSQRKPNDVRYVLLHESQRQNEKLRAKAERRNLANDDIARLGPGQFSRRLAVAAIDMAYALEHDSCFGFVEGVRHWFCIVDYRPNQRDGYPVQDGVDRVQDMPFNEGWEGAWIIDPWMNISCRYADYPVRVRAKFHKWALDGKYILTDIRGARVVTDQSDRTFIRRFLNSKIYITSPKMVQLPEERYWKTKSARSRA